MRAQGVVLAFVALAVALAAAASTFAVLNLSTPTPSGISFGSKAIEIVLPVVVLSFAVVGVIVLARRPTHLVGWSFLAFGLAGGLLVAAHGYALYGTVTAPGTLPAAARVAWITSWSWALVGALLPLLLLLFPTGRPVSPRWRWVAGIALVGGALMAAAGALHLPEAPYGDSPIPSRPPVALIRATQEVGNLLWIAGTLAGAVSLIVRYRRAVGDQRQQIKWFTYGASFVAVAVAASSLVGNEAELGPPLAAAAALSITALPLTAGMAILRYRLYDIDLVINRTLVYGALSATLVGVYLAGVLLLQVVLRPITGGSEIAVAVSTLAAAAVFQPARRSIQNAVDRRFYRSKYDARRTIAQFSARLRQEIDLDALQRELVGIVRETMEPQRVSLWLRPTRERSR